MIVRGLPRLFASLRIWIGIPLAALLLASGPARAEKRVALVIGNSAYVHAPRLRNPANDADAVGLLLTSAGFDVVDKFHDLGVEDMRRVVRHFIDRTRDAEIAVIYYAGHGIEVDGINYLVPVDAQLRRDIDVEDETVSLDRLLQVIEPAKQLRLIILDACRENPFAQSMKRTIEQRSIGRGLAIVEPSISNTLVAFAAKAGYTAADGNGLHSPFTTALLKDLPTPGLDLRIAFGRVRDDVMTTTGGRQEPFVYGSLGGTTVALVSSPVATTISTAPSAIDVATTQTWRDYDAAAKIGTKEAWDAFLTAHPTGLYADLARLQLAKATTTVPATPPDPAVRPNIKVQRPFSKRADRKSKSACVDPPHDPGRCARCAQSRAAFARMASINPGDQGVLNFRRYCGS